MQRQALNAMMRSMSRWTRERTKVETRLAAVRVERNVPQSEMSRRTGISLNTYRRIERGEITNPPIRYLTNIAIALDVPLEQICEPEWFDWTVFDERAREAPGSGAVSRSDK
jgi:transcriptional regulator with XRE-family HTH domain